MRLVESHTKTTPSLHLIPTTVLPIRNENTLSVPHFTIKTILEDSRPRVDTWRQAGFFSLILSWMLDAFPNHFFFNNVCLVLTSLTTTLLPNKRSGKSSFETPFYPWQSLERSFQQNNKMIGSHDAREVLNQTTVPSCTLDNYKKRTRLTSQWCQNTHTWQQELNPNLGPNQGKENKAIN